jgi:hypothetical protein
MGERQDEGIREILFRHAKNLLRITSIPSRREVEEFRTLIRGRLGEGGIDLGQMLREIQEKACLRAGTVASKDPPLYEYYMAIYAETAFLLSALSSNRESYRPGLAETA